MAITNAQQYKQLLAKGGRIGLKGGADASTESFSKSFDRQHGTNTASRATKDNSVNVGAGGANTRGDDGRNDNLNVPSSDTGITKRQKDKYDNQFYEKDQLSPSDKNLNFIAKHNKKKRINYINDLIASRRNKINAGLIQFQDEYGQIEGLTDFDEIEDYINNVASVTDYTKGDPNKFKDVYDPKGLYATGQKIPDFFTKIDPNAIPTLAGKGVTAVANFIGPKMAGPVTKEKLLELLGEQKTLENYLTTDNLKDISINDLKETYQPNRFKLENPEPGGGGGGQQQDPCKGPNPPAYCFVGNNTTEEDVTPTRNLGGLAPRIAGSIFNFDGLADGGRAGKMDGGMMEDTPEGGIMDLESGRQMYFLGKLVKKATRAVKKVVKSPIGKAALMYGLGAMGGSYGAGKGFFSKGMFNIGNMKRGLLGANSLMMNKAGLGSQAAMKGLFGKLGLTSGYGGLMPTLKGGITLGLGVPALMDLFGKKEEEDDGLDDYYRKNSIDIADIRNRPYNFLAPRIAGSQFAADGGRIGYQEGSKEPVAKETMPLLDMDGQEMDLREEGGFVPLGRMERADDVPARLSKNEFVFTADAVRNAGEGDIDKGAEVMYNMMKNLESGGEVSEESQGLDGAKEMFKTSQRLEEVL
jgi:hypothetical protein